ncbi:MAG: ABC transporter [Desulfuromonadaceae bacterium GWC2_58_13]|nr:MAG: ABC transporter [Desulfuromonadaceae bacterium GWC2_58_13]
MAWIEIRNLSFNYGRRPVLQNLSLAIQRGTLVALLGPNGCGKTTLLKLLLGLLPAQSGTVFFDHRPLPSLTRRERAARMAYVPQLHRPAFAYRVREVVLMGRMPHKRMLAPFSRRDHQLAEQALEKLGIGHLADRPYTEISGGERQLALIARALCQGAHTFILDEPTNGLDYGNQIRLLEQLAELAGNGYTFILSTHVPDHALWVAGQAVLMHQGTILAEGPPDQVVTRANLGRLYDAQVSILELFENFRMCFPERMACRGREKGRMKGDKHRG